MITQDQLLMHGFRASSPGSLKPGTKTLFQKRVMDESLRTLYFINVYEWDMKNGPLASLPRDTHDRYRYSVEVRMYDNPKNTAGFDVNFHPEPHHVVADVLTFYQDVYQRLGCVPDLHNG